MIVPKQQSPGPCTTVTPAVRRFGLTLAAALLSLACSAAVRAGDIVIVLSGDAPPYALAQVGLNKQFAEQKRQTRTCALQDISKKGLEGTIGANADLVVAVGTPAAVWLHKTLPATTPLVYCMVADAAGAGLAEGRATYGVSTDIALTRQFELIGAALSQARTVGMLYRSDNAESQRQIGLIRQSLPADWKLEAVATDKSASIADAIDELTRRHVDVIWTAADPSVYDTASVRALLLASLRSHTPVFGFSPAFVRAGALLGTGVDPQAQGQQAAAVALHLLKAPADAALPRINPAEHFQIAVNLIVAEKLDVQLPPDVVQRATQVFKGEK